VTLATVEVVEAELVDGEGHLEYLADRIRFEHQRCREAVEDAVEAYFAIGHSLQRARALMPSKPAFGAWFKAQQFGFSQQWGRTLRFAANHEQLVRQSLQSQLCNGRAPNLDKIVKQVRASLVGTDEPAGELPAATPVTASDEPTKFATIVIDPPWRYDNVATRGAAEDHYPTMSQEQLFDLDIPAADDAHLYLWVTNSFFEDGFALMRHWGFTYKTCLTWCKPQIGMGNYFRSTTEHVLFGVRGRLPTLRNDVPTHFVANRTKHSAKPESFYDLVEACSPGPWLEMFARRQRLGDWHVRGNETSGETWGKTA
jgi:N6-adenosine-specific RNA methylase IME4